MGRKPCCSKEDLNKGAWTAEEDKILRSYIETHGVGRWRSLPKKSGLKRCGKSCRLRWLNYLRPDIKRGNITHEEEDLIIRLHNLLGNKWSLIAGRLPGRTDNEIKNYWNTILKKKARDDQSTEPNRPVKETKASIADQTHVVRTKAVGFSKTVVSAEQDMIQNVGKKVEVELVTNAKSHDPKSCDSSPFATEEGNWWDFLKGSEVPWIDDDDVREDCDAMENWMNYPTQPDIDLDLETLASFLNYEE